MTAFDSPALKTLLKRRGEYRTANIGCVTVLAILALVLAALSPNTERHFALFISLLSVTGVLALAVVAFNIIFVRANLSELKLAIDTVIAEEFYRNEQLLSGRKIALRAAYESDELTVTRLKENQEIIINPQNAGGNIFAGGDVKFDLSALKNAPALYSTVGTRVWAFLQAYYAANLKKTELESVTITDDMGKKPLTLTIVSDGKLTGNADRNTFILKGLIK